MFPNNTHALVHLPGKPPKEEDHQLPRGECGFIQSESESGSGARQRCSCRSFYPDSLVRSRCGCGHQAWHHEIQPITMQEHMAVIEEVRRLKQELTKVEVLEQELNKERMLRVERERVWKGIEEGLYKNMGFLKVHLDDKVEAVVDKTQECHDAIKALSEKLTLVDEAGMELENRLEKVEGDRGERSIRSRQPTPAGLTPKATPLSGLPPMPSLPPIQQAISQLPIRTEKKYPLSWNARVIFVPRKSLKYAYDPDSNGYRRCASRNLHQNLEFTGQDSSSFCSVIEGSFKGLLQGRPWMPMTGYRPADEPFGRMALQTLPHDLCVKEVWDYPFIEDHCIAHDKFQGDVLYVTLQYEDVTWNQIRFLPPVHGVDESCWQHDEELDGSAGFKSLDSELMYDYPEPPPYSSRTHSLMDRAMSKLDVLADSASMLSRVERVRTNSTNNTSEINSIRSFRTEGEDDEHRDKKPKLRTKQSLPNIAGSSASSTSAMYVSGRSKRKMPVRDKAPREPLHFNVSNVAKWRPNILHPHSNKGKETAEAQ